ncbi:Stp1/IreP family PP2C-type Ser/Thr phosphatase [Paenibacillus aquistagni]|uniref:Stp1/IreP family PP2C-type Ser/Thr phosphatase n=1 Tax=Paenibacillus aquistagni TaxID=1852522 RepID=UPI00145B8964|nr:Stp1/IreP family PP2C-type Ser/Thr phosphatase [Paenibacillus aquistagni]NMM51350.1 Stp1/IreP family PP2C-type Ser/Thr phosphatase [Paenibacillus aquistagni]
MNAVHRSDVGRVRAVNEDRAYSETLDNGYTIAVVADGMGGHQAGDVASRLAVETIVRELSALPAELDAKERRSSLEQAILRANDTIFHIASQDEKYNHMGTTVVAALAYQQEVIIGHIGDSRAYVVSRNAIRQLTEDHSLVHELVRKGQITAEEAETHPRRNVLIRALGTDEDVQVDIVEWSLKNDEVLLLCSDGLTRMIDDSTIWTITIDPSLPLTVIADRLIARAIDAGGDDNVTVVLVQGQEPGIKKVGCDD